MKPKAHDEELRIAKQNTKKVIERTEILARQIHDQLIRLEPLLTDRLKEEGTGER